MSRSCILFPLEKVGNVELSTTAFGQGVSVTPIQQVTAVSAVVNGGYLYKPYIVKSIAEKETNTIIKETSKRAFVDATMEVLTSSIMDEDVKLTIEAKYTPNRKQIINNAEKALGNFIKNIDGVTDAKVAMKIGNYDSSPIEIKEVMVELETIDNADSEKIENLINLYITHTLPNVKPKQIKLYVNKF